MEEKRSNTDKMIKKYTPVMIVVYVVCCLLWILMAVIFVKKQITPQNGMTRALDFSEGWECDGQKYSMNNIDDAPLDEKGRIVLTHRIPEDISNSDLLNFNGKNVKFEVYVEGKPIYSYLIDAPIGQKGLESCFHHIFIGAENAGKDIKFVIYPAYDDSSCLLDYMRICSHGIYVETYLADFGIGFLVSILIVVLGLMMIVEHFAHLRTFKRYNFLALGLFAVIVGMWSAIETQIPVLLMGSYAGRILIFDYAALFLVWFPITRFISSLLTHQNKKGIVVVWVIQMVFAVYIIYSVYVKRTVDFHDALKFVYIDAIVFLIFIVISLIRNIILLKNDRERGGVGKFMVIGGVILIIAIAADLLYFVLTDRGGVDAAQFSRMGVAVFMLIVYIGSLIRNVDNEKLAGETKFVRRLAYVDVLTRLGNRTAFESACRELEEYIKKDDYDFILVSMDLNNLKQVNDNGGHEMGDKHLQKAARMIWDSFGNAGECFRIGGDEFAVIIKPGVECSKKRSKLDFLLKREVAPNVKEKEADSAVLEKKYRDSYNRLNVAENNYNAFDPEFPMHIACGYTRLQMTETHTIEEMIKISDSLMYENKREIKGIKTSEQK